MSERNVFNLIKTITLHDKGVMALALILLTISGLLEGISILAILPILDIALSGADGAGGIMDGSMREHVINAFEFVGISPTLVPLLAVIVIGIALKASLILWAQSMIGKTGVQYAAHLRYRLIDALMSCRWPYFVQKSTGKISAALTVETNQMASTYMSVVTFYSIVLQLFVYAGIAAFISWEILLGSIFVGGFSILILKGVVMSTRKEGFIQADAVKDLNDKLIDGLRILKPLKAMAREKQITPFLERNVERLRHSNYRQIILTNIVRLAQEPIMTLFLAIGIYLIVAHASLDMATLLFTVLIYHRMVTRIGLTQGSAQKLISQQDVYWSLNEIIQETEEQSESIGTSGKAITFNKHIDLKDISFAYGDNVILRQLNLKIPANKFVSFVGSSGAGKTTLMELIIGLNKPDSGVIKIDGVALKDADISTWRKQIGFVPQEVALTNDTILNNVTLYNQDIAEADVIDALKKAGCWSFVQDLPEGLQTIVGEQGARFSGGQRQRLSIARALAQSPSVLILDEPTTALDPDTEKEICRTLKDISKTTTVLAISHQEEIAKTSDIVFFMEDGEIQKK